MRAYGGWTVAVFACLAVSGCFGTGQPADVGNDNPAVGGIDTTTLTDAVYDVLPKTRHYVAAETTDGIMLYTEAFLPDGPGPWPTILINSPYYDHGINGDADVEATFRAYFVPRGYAVVVADVRGTGYSEGCMNMMGPLEQADTYDLVEWVAAQPWSDGKVGMYGVSYVGTTPHEALIMDPPHLTTVVTVAGVTNQWRNMFQNGVPYANRFYPLTYEALEGLPPPGDVERGPAWALNAADGACGQEDAVRSYSPGVYEKGVYDEYWAERNFTVKAGDVRASIFYNQGFADRAVNPMEAVFWFNQVDAPKKAFFGQWAHRTPDRQDWQDTLHAWFDHWLKGIDNGVMQTPTVEVVTNQDTLRNDTAWPPANTTASRWNMAPGTLQQETPAAGSQSYTAYQAARGADASLTLPDASGLAYVSAGLNEPVHMAGVPWAHLKASVDAENTYFLVSLMDHSPDGSAREVTFGWMNAHLWKTFNESNPLAPGKTYAFDFRFEPIEYVFAPGHRIGIEIRGSDSRVFPVDEFVTQNTIEYGPDGSWLQLPVLQAPDVRPRGEI